MADESLALQEEELTEAQKQWQNERRGGNYGMGTKEMQAKNYRNRKETEQKRRELFDIALSKFRKNDIQGVCPCMTGLCCQESWDGKSCPACMLCLIQHGSTACTASHQNKTHSVNGPRRPARL